MSEHSSSQVRWEMRFGGALVGLMALGLMALGACTPSGSSRGVATATPEAPAPPATLRASPPALPTEPAQPRPTSPEPPTPAPAGTGSSPGVPASMALLGGSCEATPERGTRIVCSQGKVGAVVVPVDTARDVPPKGAEVVAEWESAPKESFTVAHEGERLWVRHVTCGNCRRVMGWAFVAELDQLTEEALVELSQIVQLPKGPPLKTPEAWAEAYRSAHGQ